MERRWIVHPEWFERELSDICSEYASQVPWREVISDWVDVVIVGAVGGGIAFLALFGILLGSGGSPLAGLVVWAVCGLSCQMFYSMLRKRRLSLALSLVRQRLDEDMKICDDEFYRDVAIAVMDAGFRHGLNVMASGEDRAVKP